MGASAAGASNAMLASGLIQGMSSVGGSIAQANAMKSQGEWESQQATTNSNLAAMQAEDAKARGEVAAEEKARQDMQLMGAQRASMAGQGVSLASGSAKDIQSSTQALSELDQLTIRNNAAREAFGYKIQASNYRGQAEMSNLAAKTNARNTILTGGMNALAFTTKGYGLYARDDKGNAANRPMTFENQ